MASPIGRWSSNQQFKSIPWSRHSLPLETTKVDEESEVEFAHYYNTFVSQNFKQATYLMCNRFWHLKFSTYWALVLSISVTEHSIIAIRVNFEHWFSQQKRNSKLIN